MVSLVLVSHSRKLAEAVRELVLQMTGPDFPVAVASGVGDNFADLGTDAVHIADVLQTLNSPDGVLVLMDLGSAVLSAQTALELLETGVERIRLCSAPLVEGAIAAAVAAHAGSSLNDVVREAERGLAPKQQLADGGASTDPSALPTPSVTTVPSHTAECILTIQNEHGLHARPAALLVQTACRFSASVEIFNLTSGVGPVAARSFTSLALLQIHKGDRIRVVSRGDDCHAAIEAIGALAATGFGEPLQEGASPAPQPETTPHIARSCPAADGIAIGPLAVLHTAELALEEDPAGPPAVELAQLKAAMSAVRQELLGNKSNPANRNGGGAVLESQALILSDPVVLGKLQALIEDHGYSAVRAWREATQELAGQYAAVEDAYLRERAADVRDIERRVLRQMSGGNSQVSIELSRPAILLTDELLPSEAAACDPARVLGVITAKGSATAHSAIILRTLGIPMVVGAGGISDADAGKTIAMDGATGEFWINPGADVIDRLSKSRQLQAQQKYSAEASRLQPSITQDGMRIEILANVGNAQDALTAARQGADGVGLLRTEFLFVSRRQAPTEDEQVQALREIYAPIDGPVIVRTLDVGADKPLPFLPQAAEHNPYLGVRGIRLSLSLPELFLTHLRAILRSAADQEVWLMFPMIALAEEVEQALHFLEQAHQQLLRRDVPHRWPIKRGVMIEVPSAALIIEQLAHDLDFFSIGTNDLTQYTMAAERGSASLTNLLDTLHPAVLRLMKLVADAARQRRRHVGVCGDAASDPLAAAVFAGLGLHSLSVRPNQVPEIKALFRTLHLSDLRELTNKALGCGSATEVRGLIQKHLDMARHSAPQCCPE